MKILFITHPYPNYMPDLLLHGLRKLIGPDVIDFPRKDCLYQGVLGLGVCPADQLCPNWFPADNGLVDREDIFNKMRQGYFNFVVADIRAATFLKEQLDQWPDGMVWLDGEDVPVRINPGPYVVGRRETDGSDFSIPIPMALPEEILNWIKSFDQVPKTRSIGFLGSTEGGLRRRIAEEISKCFPDALFQTSAIPSDSNPSPAGRLSRHDYYRQLQSCQLVLSLPGAGLDTFRFWEHAACNAVHLSQRLTLYIPNGQVDGLHLLYFNDISQLKAHIDRMLNDPAQADRIMAAGRKHLIDFHLTNRRAVYFLDRIRQAFVQ